MKIKVLSPLLFTLALLLLVATFPGNRKAAALQAKGADFAAKGSMLVSGPVETVRKEKTAAGFRFAPAAREKIQLSKLDFDATLRGQKLNPESPAIRRAIEEAIQSRGWAVEDNSLQVEKQVKLRAQKEGKRIEDVEKPDVTLKARSTVMGSSISFNFTGQGKMAFRPLPAQARERKLVEGDKGEGEGLIRNFHTSVEELKPLNGSDIRIKIKFYIDQVDASGVARGRVDFELQSVK